MTMTSIPAGYEKISRQIKKDSSEVLERILKTRSIEAFPKIPKKKQLNGVGAAEAFPIQGVLKYHGLAD